jgi:hypothetical protein
MAKISERTGKKEAIDWWRRTYAVLSSIKARGLFISPNDGKAFDFLRRKCGGI